MGTKRLQLSVMLPITEEISSTGKSQTVFVAKFSGYKTVSHKTALNGVIHRDMHHSVHTILFALNKFVSECPTFVSKIRTGSDANHGNKSGLDVRF